MIELKQKMDTESFQVAFGMLPINVAQMKQIADEFRTLAQTTSVPTPAMDRLYTYIDPAVPESLL